MGGRAWLVYSNCPFQFSSVQLLSCFWLFVTPWTAARQASLSITNSRSLLKPMSIELVMPSNHLILCCPLLLPPSIFPSIIDLNIFHFSHYNLNLLEKDLGLRVLAEGLLNSYSTWKKVHFGFHSLVKERVEGEEEGGPWGGRGWWGWESWGDGGVGRGWSLTLFSPDPGFKEPLHVQGPTSQYPHHSISSPVSVLETSLQSLQNQAFSTHFFLLESNISIYCLPSLLESIILAIYCWVGQKLCFFHKMHWKPKQTFCLAQ